MGKKINVLTGYSERRNCYYHSDFEVVDRLPEIGEEHPYRWWGKVTSIEEVRPDCEWRPRNDDDWNYDFYAVTSCDDDEDSTPMVMHLAVRRPEEECDCDE